MTRELLILRHGKAKRVTSFETDFDRPLRGRGKRAAGLLGVRLSEMKILPDVVVTSPAPRALETARLAAAAMGLGAKNIVKDKRIYGASVTDLLDVLREFSVRPARLMLVGHNPGLGTLVSHLTGVQESLTTGECAYLVMPDDWHDLSRQCAKLKTIMARTEVL